MAHPHAEREGHFRSGRDSRIGRFAVTSAFCLLPFALFGAGTLSILINILTVLLVIVAFLLIGIILLQRGKGRGLAGAFGAGSMEEALGTGAASTAQKITAVLGALLLILAVLVGMLRRHAETTAPAPRPAPEAPADPGAPPEAPAVPQPEPGDGG